MTTLLISFTLDGDGDSVAFIEWWTAVFDVTFDAVFFGLTDSIMRGRLAYTNKHILIS